jgi:hypothetical protein
MVLIMQCISLEMTIDKHVNETLVTLLKKNHIEIHNSKPFIAENEKLMKKSQFH